MLLLVAGRNWPEQYGWVAMSPLCQMKVTVSALAGKPTAIAAQPTAREMRIICSYSTDVLHAAERSRLLSGTPGSLCDFLRRCLQHVEEQRKLQALTFNRTYNHK